METYVYLNPDDLYVGNSAERCDENPSLVDKIDTYHKILEALVDMQACLEEMGTSERGISRKRAARCRVYSRRGLQAIEMLKRSAEL